MPSGAQVDIANEASVAALAKLASDKFGGIDILVNNAALMVEMDMSKGCVGGKIVNQVSAGAYPAASIYGITKLAVVGLTTTLARELGKQKVNVNAIAPGNRAKPALR